MRSPLKNLVNAVFGGAGPREKYRRKVDQRRIRLERLEDRNLLTVAAWTPLTNAAPSPTGIGTMMLMPDGSVLAQGGNVVNSWYKLTPDSTGSYTNGTWSAAASMSVPRLYFGSNVLPNDKVLVVGGEYSGPSGAQNTTNTAEIYDSISNTWSPAAPFPQSHFGDDPTILLPNGTVLAGYIFSPQTYTYDPATNAWSAAATKLRSERSDEEGWVRLANGNILSYDVFNDVDHGHSTAQMYVPSLNEWVDAGTVPVDLSSSATGYELGPGTLLEDGRVFWIGSNGNTAIYTPGATNLDPGSWAAGPNVPLGRDSSGHLTVVQGADDAPAAMLPNGNVVFAVDDPLFKAPTHLYQYLPATNKIAAVSTSIDPGLTSDLSGIPSFITRMLVLPTGQVLFNDGASNTLHVYHATSGQTAWKPHITSIAFDGTGKFTMTGTQLSGRSQGAAYGDDAEMDEDYPVVSLKSATGQIYYARTSNWSTGVQAGTTPQATDFTLPAGIPAGKYIVNVSAAGIRSANFTLVVTTAELPPAAPEAAPSASIGATSLAGAIPQPSVAAASLPTVIAASAVAGPSTPDSIIATITDTDSLSHGPSASIAATDAVFGDDLLDD